LKTNFEIDHHSKVSNFLIIVAIVLITIPFGLGSLSSNSLFRNIDHFFYDQFMKNFASKGISEEITIIDIDETSLSAIGQWPWPRYQLANLVKMTGEVQPRIIGLDIFLPEPDRTSLKNIKQQFQNNFDLKLEFTGVPSSLSDNDGYLAHILKTNDVVGARYFYFDHYNKKEVCKFSPFNITDQSGLLTLNKATGVLCNTFQIENSLGFTGFTNNRHDNDGIIRKAPLLLEFNGDIYTHLSLSIILKAQGITHAQILKNNYGLYIKAGNYNIPVTKDGYVRVGFNGPAMSYKFISALDIFNGNYSASDIQDKIVLIGSSAIGLNDIHHTVFDTQFPGVEIHAAIMDNILNRQQIIQPIWAKKLIFAISLITGITMALLFINISSPMVLFAGTLVWICFVLASSILSYTKLLLFISPGLPVLIAIIIFSIVSFIRFAVARQASFLWFKKIANSQQLTMEAMVSMVETRDPETGQHIKRTQHYTNALAQSLKSEGQFPETLTDHYIENLFMSVPLHDIGKVGIPDEILLKPGKLTDEEFELMKLHTSYGRDTIKRLANKIQGDDYLKTSAEIVGSHHERWDGKGYPDGLSKEDIPLCGRIMAVCDVYDALISRRCYKPPFSHEESKKIILDGRGTLFDPVIVDAFFAIENEILDISLEFKDNAEESHKGIIEIYMNRTKSGSPE
jgi:HD-GYP domain-containing protein (c-di-GMP phosphodiesterase class II)